MKQLHEFFLHNVRGIVTAYDVIQLPGVSNQLPEPKIILPMHLTGLELQVLDRVAQLWDKLRAWERSIEQARLRSPVKFSFSKLDNILRVDVMAQGNRTVKTVKFNEDGLVFSS